MVVAFYFRLHLAYFPRPVVAIFARPEQDYFSKVAMSFFANHGYDTEGFTINPYMVVNKVFSSYYKHVQFPIVTFDELKREIQL